jgi:hypothetical protein
MTSHEKRPAVAWRSSNLFELGMGYVVVSRFKTPSEAETGAFLIDAQCLGVKDALLERLRAAEHQRLLDSLFSIGGRTRLTPACARKLVEDAVAYANQLGFPPHEDFRRACRVLGGIDPNQCDTSFVFGKDGKPLFVQGPADSPEMVRRVMRTLSNRCGADGFDYILQPGDTPNPGRSGADP